MNVGARADSRLSVVIDIVECKSETAAANRNSKGREAKEAGKR